MPKPRILQIANDGDQLVALVEHNQERCLVALNGDEWTKLPCIPCEVCDPPPEPKPEPEPEPPVDDLDDDNLDDDDDSDDDDEDDNDDD